MFEALLSLTIFGSVIWFFILTGALFLVFILSDYNENGFIATFALGAFIAINYWWGNIPLMDLITLKNVFIWFGFGLVYSIFRSVIHGAKLAEEYSGGTITKKELTRDLSEHVFRWVCLGPFSLLSWVSTSLIADMWMFIYSQVSGFYERLVLSGFKMKAKDKIKID
jgi:hypothetical protein